MSQETTPHSEELVLYGLLVVIGAIPVAFAVAHPGTFSGEASFGLLMVLAGVVGSVVRSWRRRGS
jgi:uncharacterized membrane protein